MLEEIRKMGTLRVAAILVAALTLAACSPTEIVGGAVGVTAYGAAAPTHEIEQIYYLGSVDPRGQLPPTIYRVRVHGQSSFLNATRFASGWIRSELADSLSTDFSFDLSDKSKPHDLKINKGAVEDLARLRTGRRLVQFGPEGFREAPANHRLVIVMGTSPEEYFQAMEETLGQIGEMKLAQSSAQVKSGLFDDLATLQKHLAALEEIEDEMQASLGRPPAAN